MKANMKIPKIPRLALLNTALATLTFCNASTAQQATNQYPRRAHMVLKESGPHHRLWATTNAPTTSAKPSGSGTDRFTQHLTERHVREIKSGMNYWNGQSWTPSEPSFVFTNGAFVAEKIHHRVRLDSDLATIGAVTVV